MAYPPAVLCVDDDPAVLSMTSRVLEMGGFAVLPAASGAQALQIASACRLDAAVLDYAMPEMDGAAVATALRRMTPDLPIVFYTGSPERLLQDPKLAVADAFVSKGSAVSLLGEVLRGLLTRVRRRAALRRPFSAPVIVRSHRPGAAASAAGRSFDISEGGVGSELDAGLTPGQVVWLSIQLPNTAQHLDAAARVAYRNGLRHGFQFLALPDAERNLLRSALRRQP